MEVRSWLNRRQGVATVLGIVLFAGGAYAVFRETRPEVPPIMATAYYSDDDGKTWFPDSITKLPPFDHNGKQAVRCFVFQHHGQTFVGYLQKYSDTLKARIQATNSAGDSDLMFGTLVKRPADKNWIPTSDPRSQQIIKPQPPDGSSSNIEPFGG
jgi:hypothetical protein